VPWSQMTWTATNHTYSRIPDDAFIFGMAGARLASTEKPSMAVVFLHNSNYSWTAQNASVPLRRIGGTTLKLHGMATGCYAVRWFDCTAGAWAQGGNATTLCSDVAAPGDLHLVTPPFTTNFAGLLIHARGGR
jgi:hypothetical protein